MTKKNKKILSTSINKKTSELMDAVKLAVSIGEISESRYKSY